MHKKFSLITILGLALILAIVPMISAASQSQELAAGEPEVIYPKMSDAFGPIRDIPPRDPQWLDLIEIPRKWLPNRPGDPGVPAVDPVLQGPVGPGSINILNTFEGVNNVDGVLPPDTNGDIGPNHYVQMVNLSFAIYDRNGNLLYGPANTNTLFQGLGGYCESTNDGDPIVLYDHLADRWLMSQFALPRFPFGPFYQCIAISQTGDPTGSWYRYAFQYSRNKMNDYFKFGVWTDGYYLTANQFQSGSLSWAGQGVAVFERDKMLLGQTARMLYYDLYSTDANLGGMLPSDLDGQVPPAGTPNYFAEIDDDAWGYSPDQIQLWQFKTDWQTTSNTKFTKVGTLNVAAFDTDMCGGSRNCIPQPGGTAVDAIADRLMYRMQYRNFGTHQTIMMNHTVDADGSDRAGIRWYELRNTGSGWNIFQQGTYSPDASDRWMASIAMNGSGDIALGYSISSTSIYPSINLTGRFSGDAAGMMTQGETQMTTGSGYQGHSAGRWGDYSMMSVDPLDDCTFWYTQEYYTSRDPSGAAWQTRVGSFKLRDCGTAPDYPPGVTLTNPTEGATVSGTVNVTADASDDKGVTQVEFFVDSTSLGVDTTAPYSVNWNTTSVSNGGHVVKAVATDTIGQTAQDTNNVTVSNGGGATSSHIGDLDGSKSGSLRWNATVTVIVHDNNEQPVSGATVSGSWSNGLGSSSCTTDSTGKCSMTKSSIKFSISSVTFTVSNVTHATLSYVSANNHDPDGDSNGTNITITR
jgi:hypothetical protein